jgi:hypothetical protein
VLTGQSAVAVLRGRLVGDLIGDAWVFNSGRLPVGIPPHVIFDTEARTAVWSSLAGDEFVKLDEPLVRPVAAFTPS